MALPFAGAFAQDIPDSPIEIITTFDHPAADGFTSSTGINDRGDVAGSYADVRGGTRGFIRFRNGNFSQSIVDPNDVGILSQANDLNLTTVGGIYADSNFNLHGFFLSQGIFTPFDISGAISTVISGINGAGDFVGNYNPDSVTTEAYVDIGGLVTVVTIPGSSFINTTAINNVDVAVGLYTLVTDSTDRGFIRDSQGNLTYPIDFPGSTGTIMRGINDHGLIVGSYFDQNSKDHGFLFRPPNTFASFTYPGATRTIIGGINNHDLVCGDYVDMFNSRHSFIGKIRRQ